MVIFPNDVGGISNLVNKMSLYDSSKYMFPPEENLIDTSNNTVICKTNEQLVYALACTSNITIYLNPDNGIFTFQNDPIFKTGFSTPITPSCSLVEPISGLDKVIIQGVQVTAPSFLKRGSSSSVQTFNNIYLKDCVHTKTTAGSFTFEESSSSYSNRWNFNNCDISMHVRAGDYGYYFDKQTMYLTSCSRYIEFSDLTEDNYYLHNQAILAAHTDSCTTIVKNLQWKTLEVSSGNARWPNREGTLFCNSTNSSWDVEFYKLHITQPKLQDTWDTYAYGIQLNYITNCFISLKYLVKESDVDEKFSIVGWNSAYASDSVYQVDASTVTGVNIYNYSAEDAQAEGYKPLLSTTHTAVKKLSDADCRDYNELNKWGFFVNLVEDEE